MSGGTAVLGVDFGTTHTVAALGDRAGVRVLLLDGRESLLPSCVLRISGGELVAGRTAQRSAALSPEMFLAHPKMHIDNDAWMFGRDEVPIPEVLAAVFAKVAQEARRQCQGAVPQRVVLTHPAGWHGRRLQVLREAAKLGGLGDVSLLAEPVAAAVHRLTTPGPPLQPGAALAVYDLGGGTFDAAVVVAAAADDARVLEEDGLRAGELVLRVAADGGDGGIGGAHFDARILSRLRERHHDEAPDVWDAMADPQTREARTQRRQLLEDIRAAKEGLSDARTQHVSLPGHERDATLTRGEFDDMIRADIAKTVTVLAATISDAGLSPEKIEAIYTVGGSSRIPLVHDTILSTFGKEPIPLGQAEHVVALGAAATGLAEVQPKPLPAPTPEPQPEPQPEPRPEPAPTPTPTRHVVPDPPMRDAERYKFNPPPGWPAAPVGWLPPVGWQPEAGWPAAPAGWTWYTPIESSTTKPHSNRRNTLLRAGLVLLVLAGIAIAVALGSGGDDDTPSLAAPTNLTSDVTEEEITLSWGTVAGAKKYSVWRDGVPLDDAESTTYTDKPGDTEEHTYHVYAVEEDGDFGRPSEKIAAQVAAEEEPPALTEAQQQLVDLLPTGYTDCIAFPDGEGTAVNAAVQCTATEDLTSEPTDVVPDRVYFYRFITDEQVDADFAEFSENLPRTDCRNTLTSGVSTWQFDQGAADSGDVACYANQAGTLSELVWTYESQPVMGHAQEDSGRLSDLIKWWEKSSIRLAG